MPDFNIFCLQRIIYNFRQRMNFDNIPHQWYCPITQEIMKDPVIGSDGHTYERSAIEDWLTRFEESPITRAPMKIANLTTNFALKNTIEQYFDQFEKKNQSQNKQALLSQLKKKKIVVQEQITLRTDYLGCGDYSLVNLQIIPPNQVTQANRRPCSIICILDVSESMDMDAVLGGKNIQSHGFSRLDLVKHSISTMIQFLKDCDEISIIIFSNDAQITLHPTRMNNAGKKLALQRVKQLRASGSTNIWEGLKVSLQVAKTINNHNKNVFTVLLTDGEPNINPPRGIVPTFKKYIDMQKLYTPNIHTFGYGYELDSKLLSQISSVGSGTYAYIPDCSMVGTVFINFMAAALTTVTNMSEILIQLPNQVQLKKVVGMKMNNQNKYNLGCIQYGQKRNILLKFGRQFKDPNEIIGKITLKYGVGLKNEKNINITNLNTMNKITMDEMKIRAQYLELLSGCLINGKDISLSLKQVNQFYQYLKKLYKETKSSYVESLIMELKNQNSQNQGQVEKSFAKQQWYTKWGRHYIPSLFLAHLLQVCTNFKDPGLQNYGGKQFFDFQNLMDSIFIKLPPPKPSAKKVEKVVYKPAPVHMGDYYNVGGGCIDGNCEVLMGDGSMKQIKDLTKGDKINVGNGKFGEIEFMVRTNVFSHIEMVKINKLLITPYHPIKYNGQWVFPCSVVRPQKVFVQSFYNYVISGGISLFSEGVQCISLGHNLNNNQVTEHEFFGTQMVIKQLKKSKKWETGMIELISQRRDPITNRVIGIEIKE